MCQSAESGSEGVRVQSVCEGDRGSSLQGLSESEVQVRV